jgi:enterochelin esterase-like enzyme
MKSFYCFLAFALAVPAFAQNGPTPEVSSNGRVTFRLKAPDAHEVKLQCESLGTTNMTRDEQGVWTAVTPPLQPDYYGYSFVIDGVRALDLNNPLMKYNLLGTESQVHVPGPAMLPWEVNDVPHGEIHRHFYHSKAADDNRAYFVYTPPHYTPTGAGFPVLYLLHGFSDDASAWWSVGQANIIFDNLIARQQAKPMIVVMPLGYGTLSVLYGSRNFRATNNAEKFHASLLAEVLPQVESEYNVSKDRNDRAIAGLSMGGAESLTVGLNNLDRFAWIGAFSSGGVGTNFATTFPNLDAGANDKLRLLWISCGKDDRLLAPNQAFVQWLDSKQVHHSWNEVPGVHSWRVWRRNLADFAPLLFR